MTTARWGATCFPVMFACLFGGCAAVGPDYQRPRFDAPAHWGEVQQERGAPFALEQVAWWQSFDDPMLNGLIEQAARTNLDLVQARARIAQARAALVVAGAAGMPSVTAIGSVTRSDGSNNTAAAASGASSGPNTVYQAGFDASWEVDVFGGVRRNVELSRARVDASVEDLRSTLLTLLAEVARNYINVRASQAELDVTQRNVKAQQQTVEVTQERYQLGLTSYLDVAQAQAQKAATESNIPTIEAAIKTSIHRVAILLGQEPNALKATLSASRPLPKPDGVIAPGLPAELLSRRPDLRLAERNLAAASADIGVATAALYPTFDLTLGLGLQSNGAAHFLERSSRYWSIAPGVSLPLYNGGRLRAGIAGKQAVYDEVLANYRAAFNAALEDVENALANFYTEQVRHGILADAVAANAQAVELANDRYRRGLTSFLDVLTAESALFTAQRNLSQSEANLLLDLVSLNKALGGGWGAVAVSSRGGADTPVTPR